MRLFHEQKGFSLVELVIMVVILGITLVPLTSLSISNIRNSARQIEQISGYMIAEAAIEYVWAFYGSDGFEAIEDGDLDLSGVPCETGYSIGCSVSETLTMDDVDYLKVTVTVSCPSAGDIELEALITDLAGS